MGLQGVPLAWYSGMRPSPIVWGPRSKSVFFRVSGLRSQTRFSFLPPIDRKSGWSPSDANLFLESTIITAKIQSKIDFKNVNFITAKIAVPRLPLAHHSPKPGILESIK